MIALPYRKVIYIFDLQPLKLSHVSIYVLYYLSDIKTFRDLAKYTI